MAQAKGVLPRREDREVLYKNPRTCGYFIGVKLDPSMDSARTEAWLTRASALVDGLVARGQDGAKVASVAVGLAPSFFVVNGSPRFTPEVELPAGFVRPLPNAVPPLSSVGVMDVDVMFYVASVFEARVNAFISGLTELRPDVQHVTLDRGFQRLDETEPFGYKDGLRNIHPDVRSRFVFIHRDEGELDEPVWADGGTYMVFMRIVQRPEMFAGLSDDAARDRVMGRNKDGTRLDLEGQGVDPREEPAEPLPDLPATSHVRKAGPRGKHDDTQIFRRGLPFMEVSPEGSLRVGLNFCSFQASLDQFDVVFNDWMMSRGFPPQPSGGDAGPDALFDPAAQLTMIEKVGFFFVPPYEQEGLAASVFNDRKERPRQTGRLVVHKRVTDPSDPTRRFERGGFTFQVLRSDRQLVEGAQFSTDSTGRGLCPVELPVGEEFVLQELSSPVPNVQLTETPFSMDKTNKQLQVVNQVTQPNTPYGG